MGLGLGRCPARLHPGSSAVCWAVSQQLPQGLQTARPLMLSGVHTLALLRPLLSPSCSAWETSPSGGIHGLRPGLREAQLCSASCTCTRAHTHTRTHLYTGTHSGHNSCTYTCTVHTHAQYTQNTCTCRHTQCTLCMRTHARVQTHEDSLSGCAWAVSVLVCVPSLSWCMEPSSLSPLPCLVVPPADV